MVKLMISYLKLATHWQVYIHCIASYIAISCLLSMSVITDHTLEEGHIINSWLSDTDSGTNLGHPEATFISAFGWWKLALLGFGLNDCTTLPLPFWYLSLSVLL